MCMPNLTLSISKDTFEKMKEHSDFRWSEVARKAIEEKIEDAELLNDLKDIKRAQRDFKAGKTISHEDLIKKLGLENEI